MAMNKYMHPRNIYKLPPDFKQLALQYPEFREFVKQDITGKVTIDFKDLKSLRALSCTLLKNDFGLDVEIPINKLVPTVPLRLNYILWIEDLLGLLKTTENIKGIDIGTGASCVYPLLAAKKNKWVMLATEVDSESIACAQSNVERNSLQNFIKIVKVEGEKLLEQVVGEDKYDFCMCNPPFFSSTQELHYFFKSRKSSRPHPKNAFCASVNEVVSKGGEVEFITKLIQETKNLGEKIKIYSTMIGHKCSLPPLKKALREINVKSFKEGYFCQGNTTRWGLAWTFSEDINLLKVPDPVKLINKIARPKQPIIYPLPLVEANDYSLHSVTENLLALFQELQVSVDDLTRNKNIIRYLITAKSNTWSNQRKKRREKMRKAANEGCTTCEDKSCLETETNEEHTECLLNAENNNLDTNVKSPGKRNHDDSFDNTFIKKLKISSGSTDTAVVFFKFTLSIKLYEGTISLEFNCIEESGKDRENLHQIVQYIKNNLKF